MVDVVKERTTAYLTVTFRDKAGTAVAPAAATYSVYDMTTGTEIRAATAISPAPSVEITLGATDNAIQNPGNARERRRVTVRATFGADDELNDEFEYYVQNLERAP